MWKLQFILISISISLHQSSANQFVPSIPTSDGKYDNAKNSYNSWEAAGYNRPYDNHQNSYDNHQNSYDNHQNSYDNHQNSYDNHQNSYAVTSYADQYDQGGSDSIMTNNNGYQYNKPNTDNIHMELPYSQSYNMNDQSNAASDSSHFDTIPISQHIEIMKPIPIPSIRHVPVPYSKPYHISVPYPIIVPVPQPYPVKVPVYKPVPVSVIKEFQIPIEKLSPYPVIKNIPYPVSKGVPYNVEKEVKVNVPHPYPVKIPIIKTIIHSSKNFGKGEMMGFDHHMFGEYGGFDEFSGHDDIHGDFEEHFDFKHDDKKDSKPNKKYKWDSEHDGFMMNHKYKGHSHEHNHHRNKKTNHKKHIRVIKHEGPKRSYRNSRKNSRDSYEGEYY